MMKIIAAIFACVVLLQATEKKKIGKVLEKRTITVVVTNVTSDVGNVNFALYTRETFMKLPVQTGSAKIKEGKSTVVFENVEIGEYAVVCYHDKNDNNTMDFESNGMPLEDYGASNNVINYGPPQYEDATFEVADKNVTLEIKF
ncbi:MAG: DUF2141 domain-containing protein [Polaribacter sp.]|nr:DUF2141 domain-containing protein [Polaribacter sp.]